MILLEKQYYDNVHNYLMEVSINKLFARAVLEKRVNGSVFVDNADNPKTFYVIHPYGMSLLFGRYDNSEFNTTFKQYALNENKLRDKFEWMQVFPETWDVVLKKLFEGHIIKSNDNIKKKESGIIELNTRVNFKFDKNKYFKCKSEIDTKNYRIVRTDKKIFHEMKGKVIPSAFWDNAKDFINNGIGFSLYSENQLVSTTYSSYIHDQMLEIGIETVEKFRGKGFAKIICSRLIDYCLENNYEPIWSCSLENTGSYKLALSLGFEPTIKIPYYRLSN
jgi:GNAT acetyltransferase